MTENPIRNYFKTTHNLLYSFLVSLPLFLAYEVLILISQPNSDHVVRISVDVWFKSILNSFGLDAISLSLMIVMLLGFFILYKEREKLNTLRARNFILMIAEAFVYSIIVTLVSSTVISALFNIAATDPVTSLSYIQKLALSLGAGLYEELFFRVLLVSAFVFIFNKVFNDKKWASYIASITLSAMLFSAVHYMGSMGDLFTLNSFMYRFLFGLILNGIYIWRGFGIAAWTHAIYDVIVITFLGG